MATTKRTTTTTTRRTAPRRAAPVASATRKTTTRRTAPRRASPASTVVVRDNSAWVIVGGLIGLALIIGAVFGLLYLFSNKLPTTQTDPVINITVIQPTPETVVVNNPVDPAQPAAPAAGPAVSSPLTISEFTTMWSAHFVSEGPGPLMEELNSYFDNGGYQFGGQFSGKNGWDVPAGSVVWTDLLDQSNQVYYQGTTTLVDTTKDFVRLRCQGNWCVFYTYAAVRLPTPGRYLTTDHWLDPANDLTGW